MIYAFEILGKQYVKVGFSEARYPTPGLGANKTGSRC
jgi:hypothetical protein